MKSSFCLLSCIWLALLVQHDGINDILSIQIPAPSEEPLIHIDMNNEKSTVFSDQHRRLQFEGMFDSGQTNNRKRKKGKKSGSNQRISRSQALLKAAEDIMMNSERYNLWWQGPPDSNSFKPTLWSAAHRKESNAIFTMAVIQGGQDKFICSSPNDYKLYLGTARKVFNGDIVVAIEAGFSPEIKAILIHYKAVVYEIPKDLCSRATRSIFCGSVDERVPASVFRYYFYEKWASMYADTSLLMFTDFRDIVFQSNPFEYHPLEWNTEYQMVVFQEFHPNMIIKRCRFNRKIMTECYGEDTLQTIGNRVIISSGAAMGTRDAILVWSHYMTLELQEAPGRMVETRCLSGGIDHGFISWLVYGNKLASLLKIKIYPQGEGVVNTLGGLQPDTVVANISGSIRDFWGLLNDQGYIMNWNGEISPIIHQLDHFLGELEEITDSKNNGIKDLERIHNRNTAHIKNFHPREPDGRDDRGWQALASSRCLWNCTDSPTFNMKI